MRKDYKEYKDPFYLENKDRIDELDDKVEPFLDVIDKSLNGDDEPVFLEENLNKKIVINFINGGKREGNLLNISNFGIIIKDDEQSHFYYKHSVQSYYIDE